MKNKKVISLLLIAAMLAIPTACGNNQSADHKTAVSTETKKSKDKEEKASKDDCALAGVTKKEYESMTAQDLVDRIKDVKKATEDETIALLATYAYVPYDENYEWEENITSEAIQMIEDEEGRLTYNEKVFETLVKSDCPSVCAYGFSIMRRTTENLSGYTDEQIALAEKVLGAENEPIVYVYGLQAMGSCASFSEISQFFLKMTDHEDPVVRKYAAEAVTNLSSSGVDGMTDAAIKLMGDADDEVKATACERAGQLGDERVVEPLTTILNDDGQSAFHKYCVKGLIGMWYDHPFHEHTSEAAYRACLDYWSKTPRTQTEPSSGDFNSLGSTPGSGFEEWKQKATYYNPEELGKVLLDVVRDENAHWLARSGAAAGVLQHCGDAQKAELQSIIDGLEGKDADLIRSSYEKNLK